MDKIWLEHYQTDVPHTIDINQYLSLAALFEHACQKYRNKTAFTNANTSLSFNQLDTLSQEFSNYLQQIGLCQGERVAIMLPNILQYPVILFACLRAGFVVVNTNPLYTRDEIIHQMNDSKAKVIVVMANFAHTVQQALPHTPHLQHIVITEYGDFFPPFKRILFNQLIKFHAKSPAFNIPNATWLRQAMRLGRTVKPMPVNLNHHDIACIQYTGGTTGIAKGAVLTHGNLVANILQASTWIAPLKISSQDIIVTALPLYHIFSLTANCFTFLKYGAENILITNPRDIPRMIKAIQHRKITAITGVNTLFNALLHHPHFNRINFSALKLSLSGGMALQPRVAEEWQEKTRSPILEAYGLTETSPAVSMNPMHLTSFNGSIGLPLPSTDVSIRDDQGDELAVGLSGELCVKGPQVMKAYWQHEDETRLVFWPDGFLRTGDIVRMDEQGYMYLVDRKKDMIIISGFNVYPNEVEQIITLMPQVLEVGVVGVAHHDTGEQVKACIVKLDPNLTEAEVITHCRKHLAAYKVPKFISFYTELPKTPVGKISRRELK